MSHIESGFSLPGQPFRSEMDPVKISQDLVRIPSYQYEQVMASYITTFVRESGPEGFGTLLLPTGIEGRETVIAANSQRPDVIIMGHIDSANPSDAWQYDPLGGVIENGKLYGLGVADQKGGIAAMLAAMASFKGREAEMPKVMFAFTSQEEGSLKGMEALAEYFENIHKEDPNYQPRFIISTNGSNNEVGWQCRGLVEFVLDIKGRTGHAAIRTPGTPAPINAYSEGSKSIFGVEERLLALPRTTLGLTTMNPAAGIYGLLQADGSILQSKGNQVPDVFNGVRLEFRPNGGEIDGERIDANLLLKLIEDDAVVRGLNVHEVERVHDKPSWISQREDIAWFESLVEKKTGKKPGEWPAEDHGFDEIAGVHAAVSHNNENPVGAVIWSLADRDEFHKPDESMKIDDIVQTADVLTESLRHLFLQ